MIALWRESKKIFRQVRGSENMFDYQSTVANQLYLLYCFSGKIYFTDKIHNQVKFLWYLVISCQMFLTYTIILAYLWYDFNNDLIVMFNVANAVGSIHVSALLFPFISHLYSDRIETMIGLIDNILSSKFDSDFKQSKIISEAKGKFSLLVFGFFICGTIYCLITFLEMVLFFDERKIKNYLYYLLPAVWVQEYGTFGSFFIINGVLAIPLGMMLLESLFVLGVVLYSNIVCGQEMNRICEDLDAGMGDLVFYVGPDDDFHEAWNRGFERVLDKNIKRFQRVASSIDCLRGYIQVMGFLHFTGSFFYGVLLLYLCLSDELSSTLKIKYLTAYLTTNIAIFVFYWSGQNLDNSICKVSQAVYSTPWYQSTKVRKNVYIFLFRTQWVKNLAIIKVHKLLLNNFSQYLNGLLSYTNLLRKLTNK